MPIPRWFREADDQGSQGRMKQARRMYQLIVRSCRPRLPPAFGSERREGRRDKEGSDPPVMVVLAPQAVDVQCDARLLGKGMEDVWDHLAREIANFLAPLFSITFVCVCVIEVASARDKTRHGTPDVWGSLSNEAGGHAETPGQGSRCTVSVFSRREVGRLERRRRVGGGSRGGGERSAIWERERHASAAVFKRFRDLFRSGRATTVARGKDVPGQARRRSKVWKRCRQ